MSRWQQNYDNHPFKNTWQSLIKARDELISSNDDNANLSELLRLKKVINYIDTRLEKSDKELFPYNLLPNFKEWAEFTLSRINLYANEKNQDYLIHANEHIDQILNHIHTLPIIENEIYLESTIKTINEYYKKFNEKK